jgi:hypothetical protein
MLRPVIRPFGPDDEAAAGRLLDVEFAGRMQGAVMSAVSEQGAREIWLVTTNDNLDATRAALKPSIPLVGNYGIPLHDELILVRSLP